MSTTPVLRKATNGRYYAYWSDGRRSKRHSMGTAEKNAAVKAFAQFLLLEKPQAGDATQLTFRELWDLYDQKHLRVKTASRDVIAGRGAFLLQHFGALTPDQIDQDQIDEYAQKRMRGRIGQKCQSGTVRNDLVHLRACLNWAAHPRRKLLAKTAVPDFELPEAHGIRDRWLRIPEIQRLFDAARELRRDPGRLSRGERFLWLALETAARRRAIEQLTWDRVDFEAGVIHYNVPGRRATKKRRGSPPISKALRPILERAKNEATGPYVLDSTGDVYDVVERIVKHAKLDGVSPHTFRHTAATLMARRGVPITTIADVLANSVAMCERVYRHHCPDASRQAVEHISAGLVEAAE